MSKKQSKDGHHLGVLSTVVSQDGEWMASSSIGGNIEFWDINKDENKDENAMNDDEEEESAQNHQLRRSRISTNPGESWSCCLGNHDQFLFTGSRNGTLHVYEVNEEKKQEEEGDRSKEKSILSPTPSTNPSFVMSVIASDENSICAGGCQDGSIVCYDFNTEKMITRFAETSVCIYQHFDHQPPLQLYNCPSIYIQCIISFLFFDSIHTIIYIIIIISQFQCVCLNMIFTPF